MPSGRMKIRPAGGFVPSQHLYDSLTNGRRLEIALYARENGVHSAVGKFFAGAPPDVQETKRKLMYEWMKQIDVLKEVCKTTRGRNSKRTRKQGSATTLSADAERMLILWINSLRDDGVPISALMLRIKALDIAREFGVSPEHFRATWSWQHLFLRRHRLSFRHRTRCGQTLPKMAAQKIRETNIMVNKLMCQYGVDVVHNADQTAVFFEYIPKTTLSAKGKKTVWVRSAGKDKESVTVMLLGDSHGRKYMPFVIVKMQPSKVPSVHAENIQKRHGFGVKTWKEMQTAQTARGLQIHANGRGWWTSDLSCQFLQYHFGARQDKATPVLLMWDDFAGHWTEDVRRCAERLNIVLIRVPPGYTSVCQPADIAWNHPLKTRLREYWTTFMTEQIIGRGVGESFKLQPPTRIDIMRWISDAWEKLSSLTIANGFRSVVEQVGDESAEDYSELVQSLNSLGLVDKRLGEVGDSDDFVSNELMAADSELTEVDPYCTV